MERVYKLSEIDVVAAELLAAHLVPRKDGAVVWALRGDLGAGKTALVQALARALGVNEVVTSPTFIIERVYELRDQSLTRLIHIDAYRLEVPEELSALGWDDLISNPEHFIVLEWPERVEGLLPPHTQCFTLSVVDENTRRLSYGTKT